MGDSCTVGMIDGKVAEKENGEYWRMKTLARQL